MLKKMLNILVIEDSEDDALLMIEEIRKSGREVDFKRVETEEAMKTALKNNNYDVILADYKMPHFSAPEALKALQKKEMDIPFITVSGTIGEETAAEMMRLGANDYIMKDKLTRLIPAIDREIKEAKTRSDKRRAEDELQESRERLELAIRGADIGMWDWNIKTNKTVFDKRWAEMLGYELKDIEQNADSFFNIIHPEDKNRVEKKLDRYLKNEDKEYSIEFRARCKSGKYKWILTKGKIFKKDEDGNPVRMAGTHLDINKIKTTELKRQRQLRRFLESVIEIISDIIERRDHYTSGHQERVAELAAAIARSMGFKNERVETIKLASMIHDMGKIVVPASILNKPGKLSDIEMKLIKSHPVEADKILENNRFVKIFRKIILQHHERLDGSGYPYGLKGDEIIVEAKILAVADVVEAMTSYRPYRPALGIGKAIKEIEEKKGLLYDPSVVDACIKLFKKKKFKF